jgi:hypothetical protein
LRQFSTWEESVKEIGRNNTVFLNEDVKITGKIPHFLPVLCANRGLVFRVFNVQLLLSLAWAKVMNITVFCDKFKGEIMQIVRKATVRKMIVNGTLYGRIQIAVPGWLVGKEVMVIVWTEPSIEEAFLRKKGVKLWREDEHGNVVEVKPENIELKPKVKKEAKVEEKPIEEIEVKLEDF